MFVREEVQVPAPPALVRARVDEAHHRSDRIAIAAQTALAGGPDGQPATSRDHRPAVTVEARIFNREQTDVVAMRVFTTHGQATQPTFDVNLEIQPVGEDATRLVLAGVIRPDPSSATDPAITGDSDDLRSTALGFLNELADLASTNTTLRDAR
jgi:hypothetical protein